MKHVKVHCVRMPRPCGCSSPIAAIFTNNQVDKITMESHPHIVNQSCSGRRTGKTVICRWLTVTDWLKKYTHTRNRSDMHKFLQVQCLNLKEQNPRIPESYLI